MPECPAGSPTFVVFRHPWRAVHRIDDGRVSVVHRFAGVEEPAGLGCLPNGELLVAGMARCLTYRGFDGPAAVHADLAQLAPHQIND
jgi:hypothetical protein